MKIFADLLLIGSGLLILFLILRTNTPRKRASRARRRAIDRRLAALEQLHRDCKAVYREALFEMPHLKFYQDVCWIEWHTKLADPHCADPGARPILSLEQIEKDVTMSSSSAGRFTRALPGYRITDRRVRL